MLCCVCNIVPRHYFPAYFYDNQQLKQPFTGPSQVVHKLLLLNIVNFNFLHHATGLVIIVQAVVLSHKHTVL